MRFVDMKGPVRPIIKKMARYYASVSLCDREDLIQEAWLAIVRRPHAPAGHVAYSAMTAAVASEKARKARERKCSKPEAYDMIGQIDDRIDAEAALESMDAESRSIAVLMYWHGYSRAEVARIEGIDEATVLSRLKKAGVVHPNSPKSTGLELAGFRSGALIATHRAGSNDHKQAMWVCRCDCGRTATRTAAHIKSRHARYCSRLCPERAAKSASHMAEASI